VIIEKNDNPVPVAMRTMWFFAFSNIQRALGYFNSLNYTTKFTPPPNFIRLFLISTNR
jgi:hypothetical protein